MTKPITSLNLQSIQKAHNSSNSDHHSFDLIRGRSSLPMACSIIHRLAATDTPKAAPPSSSLTCTLARPSFRRKQPRAFSSLQRRQFQTAPLMPPRLSPTSLAPPWFATHRDRDCVSRERQNEGEMIAQGGRRRRNWRRRGWLKGVERSYGRGRERIFFFFNGCEFFFSIFF